MDEIGRTTLVVVAHSDDESIGMGGTIKRHIDRSDSVFAVSMTDGVGEREGSGVEHAKARDNAASLAAEVLGFTWECKYDCVNNAMDSRPLLDVVKCIEKAKERINQGIVYTHSAADLNIDHRVVANATLNAFRPLPDERCREIRLFEVASATDYGDQALTGRFAPNLFIDIGYYWTAKEAALNACDTEMRASPPTGVRSKGSRIWHACAAIRSGCICARHSRPPGRSRVRMRVVIACSKNWFQLDDGLKERAEIIQVSQKDDLRKKHLDQFRPDIVFFPHWSWPVPEDIHASYECVVLHTAPLPYERGDSPIQNLILENFSGPCLRIEDGLRAGCRSDLRKENRQLKCLFGGDY